MPSVSRQQQKLMHGIATGSIKGGGRKPSKAVAQKFAAADSQRGPKKLPQRASGSNSSGQQQNGAPPINSPRPMQSTSAMGAALPPAPKRGGGGY